MPRAESGPICAPHLPYKISVPLEFQYLGQGKLVSPLPQVQNRLRSANNAGKGGEKGEKNEKKRGLLEGRAVKVFSPKPAGFPATCRNLGN